MEPKVYSIYKITNRLNKKIYIGVTGRVVTERWGAHCQHALNTRSAKFNRMQKAIRKYGKTNFDLEIIAQADSKGESWALEIHYIEKYNSYYKNGFGYNMTLGGETDTLKDHPNREEIIQKMKAAKLNFIPWNKGKPHSLETRKKIQQLAVRRFANPEEREKIRKAKLGKPLSKELIDKIRRGVLKVKGKRWAVCYPTVCLIIDDLKTFCRENSFNYGSVKGCCRRKSSYKGLQIRQLKEYSVI